MLNRTIQASIKLIIIVENDADVCNLLHYVVAQTDPLAIEQLVHSLVSALPHARAWPDELVWPC